MENGQDVGRERPELTNELVEEAYLENRRRGYKFTSDYFKDMTDRRLVRGLGLEDNDYELIGIAFANDGHVSCLEPVTIRVYREWTTEDEFRKYLEKRGIDTSRGSMSRENSTVFYEEGRVRLTAEGVPF